MARKTIILAEDIAEYQNLNIEFPANGFWVNAYRDVDDTYRYGRPCHAREFANEMASTTTMVRVACIHVTRLTM